MNLPVGSRYYEPTATEKVVILEGAPNRPFQIIGKVHSHCRWNWLFGWGAGGDRRMNENLRKEAATLGANAIVNVKRERFSQFEWTDVHYHGTAIRWDP
jgi:hypothetical protein